MATAFPANASISISELADRCNIHPSDADKLIQHGLTRRLFRLNPDGTLGHTAATQAMATTPYIRDFVDCMCTDIWPAAPRYVDVM